MKITIYELLGLIKDGKAPKKIKIDGYILKLTDERTNWKTLYIDDSGDYLFIDYHITLDDEVEILEEAKKDTFTGVKWFKDGNVTMSLDCSEEETEEDEFIDIEEFVFGDIEDATHFEMKTKINKVIKNQKKIINKLKEEGK